MTVDVDADSSCIYVHFFHLDDPEAARASIARLERLAVGAIPHQRQVARAASPIEEGT
jgi:multisubunit Na+/H+ antiporter MnhE subunit